MRNLFGLLMAAFSAFWMFLCARGLARALRAPDRAKWIVGLTYLLVLVGAGGFFASALSATGIIKLPSSYEWPVGYVRGVVTTADGKHIVPLMPSGRLQIYDTQWHFMRGWNVDAGGGDFKVECSSDGRIEVFTARGERHYSFTEDGHLVASTRILPETFASLPSDDSVVVPTPPLLWVFSSPFLSWGLAVIGFVGLAILKKMGSRAAL
jgi:hypothetical protein